MLGALPRWINEDDRWRAMESFERDVLAASTRAALQAKWHTVLRALAGWGLLPFSPLPC